MQALSASSRGESGEWLHQSGEGTMSAVTATVVLQSGMLALFQVDAVQAPCITCEHRRIMLDEAPCYST